MRFDSQQIEKIAKKLGLNTEEISANEVIIKMPSKDIIIKNPTVTKMRFGKEEIFQISGQVEEAVSEEDIALVMHKTGANRNDVVKALKQENDIAKAILSLKKVK